MLVQSYDSFSKQRAFLLNLSSRDPYPSGSSARVLVTFAAHWRHQYSSVTTTPWFVLQNSRFILPATLASTLSFKTSKEKPEGRNPFVSLLFPSRKLSSTRLNEYQAQWSKTTLHGRVMVDRGFVDIHQTNPKTSPFTRLSKLRAPFGGTQDPSPRS